MDYSNALKLLADDAKTISFNRSYEGKEYKEVFGMVNGMFPGIQFRKTDVKIVNQILDLKEQEDVPPAFVQASQFHAFAVIKGMIVDSSELFPLELTLDNLRKCSDYARGDFNNLRVPAYRQAHVAPKKSLQTNPNPNSKRTRRSSKKKNRKRGKSKKN